MGFIAISFFILYFLYNKISYPNLG
ncbi:conserved hypothetical protein [Thiomonas arsenitoxydans]|uniref:Uncharacterized protein n=1 Tax=Thiomonas arsenitoxydans (strain DSM 22701 / CIP 110005 / 3As) TaxID=426114 RepID=D6CQ57_THIA3|nr:hypothetical protein THI_1453 [Thiomonas arsenitoxydans]CQR32802.1 conserved hypothetical protein [Thiomonas arsenitoxydans]CQR34194.1 conserved hypothetical protein [Thiomonas arsenitoxydans]CQR40479.1 conserved hypothetical protein [Thiomonas arsenitoxydans]